MLRLHRHDKIDRALNGWKQSFKKCSILADQKVMPYTGSDVGDIIGLAPGDIGWRAINVRGPPTAVVQLLSGKPVIGTLGGHELSGNTETHCGLCVIPGVGVSTVKPGDLAVLSL